jgi:hypothetical protein
MERLYNMDETPVEETTANEEKHLNHPFYAEANQYRETVRREQVLKGAHKYPEPFNPFSWSPKELLQHAMQENVDQGHYEYGLYLWIERMEKERDDWKERFQDLKTDGENEIYGLELLAEKVSKERDEWKKQYLKAHAEIQDLQYKLKVAEKERDEFKRAWGCSSEAKTHDCSKNQAIHWQGKDIVKVKCQICDKTLYQA